MGRGGREGWAGRAPGLQRGPGTGELRSGPEGPAGPRRGGAGLAAGGRAAPVSHLWICAGGRGRAAFPRSPPEGREPGGVLERAWPRGGGGGGGEPARSTAFASPQRCAGG